MSEEIEEIFLITENKGIRAVRKWSFRFCESFRKLRDALRRN